MKLPVLRRDVLVTVGLNQSSNLGVEPACHLGRNSQLACLKDSHHGVCVPIRSGPQRQSTNLWMRTNRQWANARSGAGHDFHPSGDPVVTSLKKKASASIDAANEIVVPEDVPEAERLRSWR